MDPLTIAAAGTSVLAPIIGGIIGGGASSADKEKALELQRQALENIMNVNTPEAEQLKIALEKYSLAGEVAPQMNELIQQDPSVLANIQVDPRLRNAQMTALESLQKVGAGELRPEDMAALNKIKQQSVMQEKASREAILQNMQQRGAGGSGAELAANLVNAQNASNRASSQDIDVAGQASQRALQAIYDTGNLAGSVSGQQFGQEAQKATAQDVINRYNAMNAQGISSANTGLINQAQTKNLENKQAISNANVGVSNRQTEYNAKVPQQVYENALNKAKTAAGVATDTSKAYNTQAGNTQTMWSGIGQGVGKAGAAIAGGALKATPSAPTEEEASDDWKKFLNQNNNGTMNA